MNIERGTRAADRASRSARARAVAGAVAVVALVGLSACGQKGGNDSSPANNETQATAGKSDQGGSPTTRARSTASSTRSTERRSTSSTRDSSSSTTASSTPRSTTTRVPVAVNPDSQYKDFCQAFADVINDPTFNNANLDDIPGMIASFKKIYQELADKAPEPIAADWKMLNEKIQAVTPENFMEMGTDPETNAATNRISEWTKTNCGFDPNNSSSSGSGSSGGNRTGDN